MVKKIFTTLLVSVAFLGSVNAEAYYTNSNGVELTEDEYNFVLDLYNENYLDRLTQDDYDFLSENDIFGQEVIHVSSDDVNLNNGIMPLSYFYETRYKKLEASYACGSQCGFYATLEWKILPGFRSYDHFGMYGSNISYPTQFSSYMFKGSTSSSPVVSIRQYNGVAATYKLPTTNPSSLVLDLSFYIEKRGSVYISYQHAQDNVTLANSRRFTLSHAGYGHVFLFDQDVRQYYDQMGGLTIYLS